MRERVLMGARGRLGTMMILVLLIPGFVINAQGIKSLSPDEAVYVALNNNLEIKSYELRISQKKALVPSAFSFDKAGIFYGLDENNIAENGHPLKITGIEQSFNFPGLYFAQRSAYIAEQSISESTYQVKRRELEKEVYQSAYKLLFLFNKQKKYQYLDSLYENFSDYAEQKYRLGETAYLETLNSRAVHNRLSTKTRQLEMDILSALESLNGLLQSHEYYTITYETLPELITVEELQQSNPMADYYKNISTLANVRIGVERNNWLPDINLTYFSGTNNYQDAKVYTGYQVGITLPLFFAGQRANTKAAKIEREIAETEAEHFRIMNQANSSALKQEIASYREAIEYYRNTGRELAEELIKTANESYRNGGIDFFQYIQSLENAIEIELEYLENLNNYNFVVLEWNYITY